MGDTVRVRNAGAVLLAISVGAFLATFNETFLNVALTPIMQDFTLTSGTVQWVSTAYMLVAAVTVPVTSFLYRSVPTKALNLAALVLLLAGTLVGAAAVNFPMLLAGRCIQALGTGMIVPIGMNLTLLVAPQGKLGTYMGVVSAVTLLGPAFGPIAGGMLLSVASWHFLFIVFAVLVVLALVVTALFVDNFEELTHPKLDAASVALVSLGLVGIMFGVSTVFSGGIALAVASLAIGAASMVAFVLRQRRIPEPLLDLRPFADRGFVCGVVVVFIAFMAVFAMNILLPLFMQNALGFSALDAALTLVVPCLSCVVFAPLAGRLYDRYGFRFSLPAALIVMAAFLFAMSRIVGAANALVLAALYLPILAGCNFSIGPAQSFALDRLPAELHPHGVTVCYTAIQVAGCIGSSFYVGIMGGVEGQAIAAGAAAQTATASGFSVAVTVAAALAFVGFCFAVATARLSASGKRTLRKDASKGGATLASVMFSDVYSIPAKATAYDALVAMAAKRTSGLPLVNEDGTLAGFLSDGDVLRAISDESVDKLDMAYVYSVWQRNGSLEASLDKLKDVPALSLATRKVVSVEVDEGLDAVCAKLSEANIKKLPVTRDGAVVGVISRSNVLRYLVSCASGEAVRQAVARGAQPASGAHAAA